MMKFRNLGFIFFASLFGFVALPGLAEELSTAQLKAAFVEANKGLPQMIDPDTRLDRIEAGAGEAVYFYTFVNHTYGQFDWKMFTDLILPTAKKNFCTSPNMGAFREGGVGMLYVYYDKNGELVGTIKVPNNICD